MPTQPFTPESFQTFGDLLKYLRRREHLTQLELSIIVGYSEAQIGRLEKNQRRPDLTALKALFIPALHFEHEPELVARFLELAQAARQEDAPAPGIAPYKGLLFFDESDSELFFGRETLTAHLANRVAGLAMDASTRFMAVVGASGSGKSSLVRAGLAVTLNHTGWDVRIFTPGTNPLKALEMQFDSNQAKAESDRVLILVDQFEETFTLCHIESERVAFIEKLLSLASSPNIIVVIALRADFYSHCAHYPLLRQAVAAEQEYIGQMTTDELRRAIEEPAKRGGWEFEPGLVDVLLNDIGADGMGQPEPGALPLLSHALLATWERRRGRTFTLDGYHASGGVRGAIAETAESVFTDQLNQKQQELARDIFLRLTELGEGTEDTRRRAALNELVRQSAEATQLRAVLNTLAEARLITLNEDSAEVAHEALIREWQRLHEWLTQDREGLHLHRHLTESTREWETMGREPSELYRGARLAQVREWIVINEERLNESERTFLTASIEKEEHDALEQETQRQRELEAAQNLAETKSQSEFRLRGRNRIISMVGVVALLLAMLAGIFGLRSDQNAKQAEQQRNIALNAQATSQAETNARATAQADAEANFNRAEAQRLASEAINLLNSNGNSDTVALLALRSLNLEYSPQGDAALLSAINLNYPLQIFTGNMDVVNQIAFSPDDKMILTGSFDNTARLFDIETGKQLQVFSGHTAPLNDIVFSADGKWVLTGSQDQTARLWDTATGLKLQTFIGHTNFVITVAFTADGKQIMTGSEDGTMRLWDVETGRELKQWFIKDPVSAFSPDSNYAVGYSEADNANHLWDTKALTIIHSFTRPTPPNRFGILFSTDGKYLLAGFSGDIVLFDVASGQELQVFKGHTGAVTKLAFSPDGKNILSASRDETARLWDIQTGQEVQRFNIISSSIAFSSDRKQILTGSLDGTVRVWDVEPHPQLPILDGQKGSMFGVAFSPDGKYLATNVLNNELQLWDIASDQTLWSAKGTGLALWALKYSPDGKYLLSGNMDGVTTLWDAETGEEVRQFTAEGLDEINTLAFSPDGKTIVAGGADNARDVDFAMRWGFGQKLGPFESWQAAGWQQIATWVKEDIDAGKALCSAPLPAWVFDGPVMANAGVHTADGSWSPARKASVGRSELPVYRRQAFRATLLGEGAVDGNTAGTTVFEDESVRIWHQNDDVLVLSLKTKMHVIGAGVIAGLSKAIAEAEANYNGLVIWGADAAEGGAFSAGADLQSMLPLFMSGGVKAIGPEVAKLQQAFQAMKYANVPVVAAVAGLALGGGCELALHTARRVASIESYIGLVEVGVGLIPAGGGLKEAALRAAADAKGNDLLQFLKNYFMNAATAAVSKSALEARQMGYLKADDIIVFNPYELLHVAKVEARAMFDAGYRPPLQKLVPVTGRYAIATIMAQLVNMRDGGFISAHDFKLGQMIATVVAGGDVDQGSLVSEQWLLDLERKAFMELLNHPKTQERIMGMMQTGKPVRN